MLEFKPIGKIEASARAKNASMRTGGDAIGKRGSIDFWRLEKVEVLISPALYLCKPGFQLPLGDNFFINGSIKVAREIFLRDSDLGAAVA